MGNYDEAAKIEVLRYGKINFQSFTLMELTVTSKFSIFLQCKYCYRLLRCDITFFFLVGDKDNTMTLSKEEFTDLFKKIKVENTEQITELYEKANVDILTEGLSIQEFTYAILRYLYEMEFLKQTDTEEKIVRIIDEILKDKNSALARDKDDPLGKNSEKIQQSTISETEKIPNNPIKNEGIQNSN